MTSNRRVFLMQVMATSATVLAASHVQAQGKPLEESDPQATSLGYKQDATKVDTKKYPKYAAGQQCSSCALFQGKATDATGACPLFAGKTVAGKGWCSAWAKKS